MDEVQAVVLALEMVGVAAFAISGVMVAIESELDMLGALVLGAITSVGGGVIRDVMLGVLPPALFVDPRYVLVAVGVSLAAFIVALCMGERFLRHLERLGPLINTLDAVGLGIFVTVGVDAALRAGLWRQRVPRHLRRYDDRRRRRHPARPARRQGAHGAQKARLCAGGRRRRRRLLLHGAVEPAAPRRPVPVRRLVVTIRLLAAHFRWNLPHIRRS